MARQETLSRTPTQGSSPGGEGLSLPLTARSYSTSAQSLEALAEISRSVEKKTGWHVDLSEVAVRVVSSPELQRRSREDVARRTGIPVGVPQPSETSSLASALVSARHSGVVAVYLPSEKALIVNEESVGRISHDALKSTLHYELTRAAQHQRYPEFIASVDNLARERRLLGKHGADVPAEERECRLAVLTDKAQARMALIEGQALELRRMYEIEAGVHSEVRMGPVEVALGLPARLVDIERETIVSYCRGQAIFAKIHAIGAHEVDRLFKAPHIVDQVFGARRPE